MKSWYSVLFSFLLIVFGVNVLSAQSPERRMNTGLGAATLTLPSSNIRLDSLKKLLDSTQVDTLRVGILIDLGRELWATSPREARSYAAEALGIAERVGFKRGIANALNTIGVSYFYQGWYDIALEHYQKSLAIRQEIKDLRGIGNSINNIGLIYAAQNKHDEALKYGFQALAVYKESNAKSSSAAAYNNIGIAYRKKKMFDSAEAMHQAALEVLKSINNPNGLALTYNSFGTLYLERGDYQRALEYQRTAISLYQKNNNHKGLLDAHFGAATALKSGGKYDAALRSLDSAMMFANSLNARKELRDCFGVLAEIEEKIGNFSGAYYNLKRYEALKDSLFSEEVSTKAAEFNAKYDAEMRSKQIALLTSEKERQTLLRNVLLGASLMGLIGAMLLYNRYRLKQRSEAALQAANAELNTKNVLIEQSRFIAERLLLNVLPQPIAERMQRGEQRIAERFEDVTVIFVDIVNFTRFSTQIPPEELVTLLDAVFSDFDALAERYELEKIKTIGDAYMAVCGIPQARTDHAECVAQFALDVQRVIGKYSIDAPSEGNELHSLPLQVRIGIHSGAVVAGVIGKKKFSFDLWGDTVNIASRLQTHAKAGEIQCSESSYRLLQKKCIFENRGTVELKGKFAVNTFILKGFSSAAEVE
jgi:class 3 adenylate cyclase